MNYTITGEHDWGSQIAWVDNPNEEYFRYFSAGYGMSQAYSAHKRVGIMRCAISEEEKRRVMGQNLNGCERARDYNYDSWLSHFKPVYEIRKAEYLAHIEDPNIPFDYDVNWPIDTDPNTGGWFRAAPDANAINVTSTSADIVWTTPVKTDSWVIYTSNGYWWYWEDSQGKPHYPDGWERRDKVDRVFNHTINLPPDGFEDLDPNTWYEYRIRSTNDTNDTPAVPGQIIWGYVGEFKTEEQ